MKFLTVWHYCGHYGFQIPWAKWMCHGVYPACPAYVRDSNECVQIYSVDGQPDPKPTDWDELAKRYDASINIDNEFVEGGIVDEDSLLHAIMATASTKLMWKERHPQ